MILRNSLVLLVLVLSACKTTKKPVTPAVAVVEPAIQLDTIQVTPKDSIKKTFYRATNTRLNDIIHTKLEVSFDWDNSRLNGKATLQIKPYFYPVNMLYLNARSMEIKSVEVFEVTSVTEKKKSGKQTVEQKNEVWNKVVSAMHKYENDSLKINLGKSFAGSQNYYVVIDYISKPNERTSAGGSAAITDDKGLYFINPKGENIYKMPQIWTQGETQASSAWFPTIDSPNERMTQEILMTVDNKFTTLSNGVLVSSTKKDEILRVDHWRLDQPHAPYLAMMAVGEYKKVVDEPWSGKEISYFVEKEYEEFAKDIFGDTREMIDFYSKKLGVDYPWGKYSQIVARDYVSGAMENTTATLHGDFLVYQTRREMIDGKKGTSVIAHELFHQWFGDYVTCESWSNLPLNESFATYGEYLWEEYKYGREAADHHSTMSRDGYIHADKEANLIRFDYKDKEDMFDAISYNKGGQVLHMLRKVVGDSAFFVSLKNYLETNKHKSVEVHNLRLAFEETTGRDLNWFFNQWFLNKGRPKLKIEVKKNASNIELTAEQKQDLSKFPLYRLPVEVDLYIGDKTERKHIEITEQKQTFTLTASGPVELVNFDAERQLLADINYERSGEEYVFQYKNGRLYGDRREALLALAPGIADPQVFEVFKLAAEKDKNFQLRNLAIARLEKVSPDKADELKTSLTGIFTSDSNTVTRAKALNVLNKRFGVDQDVKDLNEAALKEQSYAICGEALEMLSKHSPQMAMQKAKQFEKEGGKDILFPVANLYSNHGADEQMSFFHEVITRFNGYEIMSFCALYAKTAKRCADPAGPITAATDLEYLSKGANKFTKFAALKGIKDIATVWENKEKSLQQKLDAARKDNKPTAELEKSVKESAETKETITKIYDRASK